MGPVRGRPATAQAGLAPRSNGEVALTPAAALRRPALGAVQMLYVLPKTCLFLFVGSEQTKGRCVLDSLLQTPAWTAGGRKARPASTARATAPRAFVAPGVAKPCERTDRRNRNPRQPLEKARNRSRTRGRRAASPDRAEPGLFGGGGRTAQRRERPEYWPQALEKAQNGLGNDKGRRAAALATQFSIRPLRPRSRGCRPPPSAATSLAGALGSSPTL